VELKRAVRGMWMFACSATVDGREVASAEIMCTLKAVQ
jgi:3-hydroxymyristoyl/3-hydroxydecanoyl-(acyl carrier protein) dehydratase